jgi:hypothetical protein
MKAKLRAAIAAGRDKEASDLVPHVDDSAQSKAGQWTAKDNLAHLAQWRFNNAAELDAIRMGGTIPDWSDETAANAEIYTRTHGLPAGEILEAGRSSWDALAIAMEACSNEQLLGGRLRRPQEPAWQTVGNSVYFHLVDHLGSWHLDRGDDVEELVSGATWAWNLARATSLDIRQVAAARYNLGCIYARGGRAMLAMPHLLAAFEEDPSLREWAKQDADLAAIRSAPELVNLLGPR